MGRKAPKSARKFAASGQLKKVIQARQKHQQIKKRTQGRRGAAKDVKGKRPQRQEDDEDKEDVDEEEVKEKKAKRGKVTSVDDFLSAGFMDADDSDDEEDDDDDGGEGGSDGDSDDEGDEQLDDDDDFSSVDEIEDEGAAHLIELSKLAEKDPEFYAYLQENDKELLDFNPKKISGPASDPGFDEDEDMEEEQEKKIPTLTEDILRKWQQALLEHRSLRALRKLLIAFRSAAHMNEEGQVVAWNIDSSSMYDKLVTTALKYTPVVLAHHVPCKTLPNGRIKPPTQTPKLKSLQKLIISYFQNATHLLSQLSDNSELLKLVVSESAKVTPYVMSSRRGVKTYVKKCLDIWSTSSAPDDVRIAAYLAVRRVADIGDESGGDAVMKNMYLTFVRSCKTTTGYTLPSITLMKNSAAEMFCLDHASCYQLAFGYIRQLAIHLRNSLKVKTKESYKLVYNWQYVHCVDFWCIVLAKACDTNAEKESGKESELKALIYPLVQVSLGAIKLIPSPRSYPLHLHLLRSLTHLLTHTKTYMPLFPYILPIVTYALSPGTKPKHSTLKPLDLETTIRCPGQYAKTRIYTTGLVEESLFILAEYLASPVVGHSIAFPEITVPITVALKRLVKNGGGKEAGQVKVLVERIGDAVRWIEGRRVGVAFGPAELERVREWEEEVGRKEGGKEEGPLGKYVKVLRKGREARRRLIEKAREEKDEIVGEDESEDDSDGGEDEDESDS